MSIQLLTTLQILSNNLRLIFHDWSKIRVIVAEGRKVCAREAEALWKSLGIPSDLIELELQDGHISHLP
jgi:hypothetical protein